MFTKSLPTTNYPAILPWCHGSCGKEKKKKQKCSKWKCGQPIQFNVLIVVVCRHTCVLATFWWWNGSDDFADSIHLLLVYIFVDWDRERARVCVCVGMYGAIHWFCFGVFGERASARKRYLKSGKLPRLFIKIKNVLLLLLLSVSPYGAFGIGKYCYFFSFFRVYIVLFIVVVFFFAVAMDV